MRTRRWRLVAAGLAALVALVALVGLAAVVRRAAGPDRGAGAWRPVPGAFAAPRGATAAATVLLPAPNGCFYALGTVDAERVRYTGIWHGAGACDSARLEWPVDLPPASRRFPERDTVVGTAEQDGTRMTVVASTTGEHAWGDALRGTPGSWEAEHLREPPDDQDDVPTATGVVLAQFAVVGLHGGRPTIYFSPGSGPWHDRPLPAPEGGAAQPVGVAGAPDAFRARPGATDGPRFVDEPGPGVVVGRTDRGGVVWSTVDGGTTWPVQALPEAAELTGVAYDGSAFVAVGAGRDGAALVLVSSDGVSWRPDPHGVPAGARPFRSVHALRPPKQGGRLVLGGSPPPPPAIFAVGPTGPADQPADRQCATAWRRDARSWVAEPLGCHGVPTSLCQLADGRIAAVGGTTLWLRRP